MSGKTPSPSANPKKTSATLQGLKRSLSTGVSAPKQTKKEKANLTKPKVGLVVNSNVLKQFPQMPKSATSASAQRQSTSVLQKSHSMISNERQIPLMAKSVGGTAPNNTQKLTSFQTASGESFFLLPPSYQFIDNKTNSAGPGKPVRKITLGELKKSMPSLIPQLQNKTTVVEGSKTKDLADLKIMTMETTDDEAMCENGTEKCISEIISSILYDDESSKVIDETNFELQDNFHARDDLFDYDGVASDASRGVDFHVQSIEKVDVKDTAKITALEKLAHDQNCCCDGCHQLTLHLLNKINELTEEVKSLKLNIEKQNKSSSRVEKVFDLLPPLPINTHEDLLDFEEKLTVDTEENDSEKVQAQLKDKMSRYGGPTIWDAVKNIMPKIFTDELLDLCTWNVEKGGKIALGNAAFVTLMTDVILEMKLPEEKASIDDVNIKKSIHKWVSKSYNRTAKKRAKEAEKLSKNQ
ncbi:hypothetical protein QAD02_023986 [Eretmocerus hayati]|uniref:Uncharacterized protein n=1 Tax=Eretmocerus hayati TaxID=131215 RepID=A0ACC2PXC5_9HYME|nr:hypothetical protein QAD02_023986 [Eretmocerus hayati]